MTSHFGRYRSVSALCCTGNGEGLVGFGMAKAPIYMPALRRAKNRAGQRLMYIPRYEDRTST
jgi:small subunit ribosomal protein S5